MPDKNNKDNYYLSFGIGFGLLLGGAVGLMFNNIAMGSGIGVLIGIIIGTMIDSWKSKK